MHFRIMYQTGYLAYTTLAKGLPYNGGFCKWYYVDRAQLLTFPEINPLTQYLRYEPAIYGSWCGPVVVPNDQLGYEETPKRDGAGLYWQHKVSGFHPGDDPFSRINIENMHYYEFIIVGKLRAGGTHILIGDQEHGLTFDASFSSTGKNAAGNTFTFSGNLLNKAFILPIFGGSNTIPPYEPGDPSGGFEPIPTTSNVDAEVFYYSENDTSIQIPWDNTRKSRFGNYPLIEVWYNEEGVYRLATNPVITVNTFPPQTTLFTVTLNSPGPGIVVVK